MPSEIQKKVIESLALGLRVRGPANPIVGGSYYACHPVTDDWDARFQRTCEVIFAARGQDKELLIFGSTHTGNQAFIENNQGPTLMYGRTHQSVTILKTMSLTSAETIDGIRNGLLAQFTRWQPSEKAAPDLTVVGSAGTGDV